MFKILPALLLWALNAQALESNWAVAEAKLKAAGGFSPEFVAALKEAHDSEHFDEIVELNTLLFLKRNDYHGVQVTAEAVGEVDRFATENAEALKLAQETYGVDPKVIVSLLWIESRHGQNLGRFLITDVFVDLLQCDRPAVLKHLNEAGKRFTKKITRSKRRGIAKRAHRRVKWAIAELRAVEKMWKSDDKVLKTLRGSFAGAFGMPQFEPSSYASYAKAAQSGKPADLSLAADAIQSVGFYLKENGWRNTSHSHIRALMRYNNSRDYARAILKLAKITPRFSTRVPADEAVNKTDESK